MKRKIMILGCALLTLTLSACGGAKEPDAASINANTIAAQFLVTQYEYAAANQIPLQSFSEQSKLAGWYEENAVALDKAPEELLFVEPTGFSDRYELTRRESGYYYVGELKDNQPDGFGMILQRDTLRSDYDDPTYSYLYIGSFEKGLYEGYGLLFRVPTIDNGGYGDLNTIFQYVTEDQTSDLFQRWYLGGSNYVVYEGMFHKGERDGLGNSFSTSIANTVDYSTDPQTAMDRGLTYWINTGEFKDDQMDGAVRQYCAGYLYYDGEMKDGERSGDGKEYYMGSTQLRYEGEFDHDTYDGKGTMYAEDGSEIYSGKWRDGDYD